MPVVQQRQVSALLTSTTMTRQQPQTQTMTLQSHRCYLQTQKQAMTVRWPLRQHCPRWTSDQDHHRHR